MARSLLPWRRAGAIRPSAKASSIGKLLVPFGVGEPRFTPRRYDALAREGYQHNVIVYRCVRLIAQNAAAVPWRLSSGRGPGRRELTDHPLLTLLECPNPMQGGAQFFEAVYGFFLIAGNSYAEGVGPEGAAPVELWTLRPDRMSVVPGKRGVPERYRYSVGGTQHDFAVDPLQGRSAILHSKAFHPLDDWYGMSPLEAAAFSVDQHNEAAKWNAALLQNSARPSGALIYSPKSGDAADTLTDTQRRSIRAEFDEQFGGARNAGRPLVLEGGLDWKEMSLSPKAMEWLKGKDVSAREVALAYHVPPQLIGIEGSLTFANYEQARISLFEDAVLPLLDFYKDEFNRWLTPSFGDDLTLDYDTDSIAALGPRREKVWARVRDADFLTLNEKRTAVGYAPMDGGDVLAPPKPKPENESRG